MNITININIDCTRYLVPGIPYYANELPHQYHLRAWGGIITSYIRTRYTIYQECRTPDTIYYVVALKKM